MNPENQFNKIKQEIAKTPEKTEEYVYEIKPGNTVRIKSREFKPDNKEESSEGRAVILLPGWEAEPEDRVTISLGKEFCKASEETTYVISSEMESKTHEPENGIIYEESLAIANFIKKHNLKKIKLVGYSIGGDRAINTASILQEDTEIQIEGLVLLASSGLYDQEPLEVVKNLLSDSFVRTPKNLLKTKDQYSNFKEWIKVALEVNSNTVKKTISSPSHIGKLKRYIKELSTTNPRASSLKIPIILINGKKDSVSDYKKINPDKIFSESPYVKMVTAEKADNHGLPFFRTETVANVSIGLLDRHNNQNDKIEK